MSNILEYVQQNWLQILGTICGLVYLWQELKASIFMWVTGIIMPAISIFVYYNAGLYADSGINVYYFLAAVYGFLVWRFGKKKDEKVRPITFIPRKMYWRMSLVCAAIFVAIGWGLKTYTDSNVPWWDSFTTALSIIGLWMLARKWVEQWIVWIVVDGIYCGLYFYKEIYFYSALYCLYTIIAMYGYKRWKSMIDGKVE